MHQVRVFHHAFYIFLRGSTGFMIWGSIVMTRSDRYATRRVWTSVLELLVNPCCSRFKIRPADRQTILIYISFKTCKSNPTPSNTIQHIILDLKPNHILHSGHHACTSCSTRWQIRAWNTPWSLALEFTMLVCLRGIARPTCRCFRWLVDVNPWEFAPWEPGKVVEELFVEAKIMVPLNQKQCRREIASSLWQRLMINDDWLRIITDGLSTMKSEEAWWEKIQQMQSLRVKLM